MFPLSLKSRKCSFNKTINVGILNILTFNVIEPEIILYKNESLLLSISSFMKWLFDTRYEAIDGGLKELNFGLEDKVDIKTSITDTTQISKQGPELPWTEL